MGRFELFEEPHVVLREHSQVFYLVFEVGNALDTHTEGITAVHLAVDAAGVEYIGIDHAAAQNLYPTGVFAEGAPFTAADVARDVHFGRRFGEGEVGGAEPYLSFAAEHLFGKVEQSLFQVGKGDVFIYVKCLYLVEEAVSPIGDGFVAVDTARADDADRGLCMLHRAGLNR